MNQGGKIGGSKRKIKFENNYSEEFEVTVWLKYWNALSPMLFNISLEEVAWKVQEVAIGVRFNGKVHA